MQVCKDRVHHGRDHTREHGIRGYERLEVIAVRGEPREEGRIGGAAILCHPVRPIRLPVVHSEPHRVVHPDRPIRIRHVIFYVRRREPQPLRDVDVQAGQGHNHGHRLVQLLVAQDEHRVSRHDVPPLSVPIQQGEEGGPVDYPHVDVVHVGCTDCVDDGVELAHRGVAPDGGLVGDFHAGRGHDTIHIDRVPRVELGRREQYYPGDV
mmetsp:Transcript_68289/g.216055  ORF Transcript_68289/g.216055 Transcript_68289/m.216055 type:complete len:208 (+) Transcript_68289:379-1002(+)